MKKSFRYSLLLSLGILLFCCSQERTENKKILVSINNYKLSLDEFQHHLAAELELDEDFKLTKESKKGFLEEIIRKELLIQEAKNLQIDKKAKFIKTIERYWESTLIRDLMEIKGKEISRTILISQEEIKARYDEMKKSGEILPPPAAAEKKIRQDLKDEKKTELLRQWIIDLEKKGEIKINQELLDKE